MVSGEVRAELVLLVVGVGLGPTMSSEGGGMESEVGSDGLRVGCGDGGGATDGGEGVGVGKTGGVETGWEEAAALVGCVGVLAVGMIAVLTGRSMGRSSPGLEVAVGERTGVVGDLVGRVVLTAESTGSSGPDPEPEPTIGEVLGTTVLP